MITVSVDATSSVAGPSGPITGVEWTWGDGTANGSGMTTTHDYASAGRYSIICKVTGTDPDGTSTTAHSVDLS